MIDLCRGRVITSGGFSPTVNMGIGLGRVSLLENIASCPNTFVQIRGKLKPVTLVKPPFICKGKAVY